MTHPDYKKALANLRKVAKLEAKKAAIERQINDLGADQFMFDEVAFNLARHDHEAELENLGIDHDTGEIRQKDAA